jgi:hypothetical protein
MAAVARNAGRKAGANREADTRRAAGRKSLGATIATTIDGREDEKKYGRGRALAGGGDESRGGRDRFLFQKASPSGSSPSGSPTRWLAQSSDGLAQGPPSSRDIKEIATTTWSGRSIE